MKSSSDPFTEGNSDHFCSLYQGESKGSRSRCWLSTCSVSLNDSSETSSSLPMPKWWWICTAGVCSYRSLAALCKGEKVLAHGYGLAHRKDGRALSLPLDCTPQKIVPLILCLKGIWLVEVCKSVHCSFMWLAWYVSPSPALWKTFFFKSCHSPILYRKILV